MTKQGRCVCALILCLLTACGGGDKDPGATSLEPDTPSSATSAPPTSEPTSTASSAPRRSPEGSPTEPEPETRTALPPPPETDTPLPKQKPKKTRSPEKPPRTVELAGPTITDYYRAKWGVFADPTRECSDFYWPTGRAPDVPMTVTGISATSPFVVVGTQGCPEGPGGPPADEPCLGFVFKPGLSEEENECVLAIRLPQSADGRDHTHGSSVVTLVGRCTRNTGQVCGRLSGEDRATPDSPITVKLRHVTELRACLKTYPDGENSGYLAADENCNRPAPEPAP